MLVSQLKYLWINILFLLTDIKIHILYWDHLHYTNYNLLMNRINTTVGNFSKEPIYFKDRSKLHTSLINNLLSTRACGSGHPLKSIYLIVSGIYLLGLGSPQAYFSLERTDNFCCSSVRGNKVPIIICPKMIRMYQEYLL